MRKFPYVGTYPLREEGIALAAQCGNFIIINPVTLLHTPGLLERVAAFPHLKLVLQLHILDEVWTNRDYEWVQLAHIRVALENAGLWDRVVAVIIDEECMTGALGGGPTGNRFARLGCTSPDSYARIEWVCERLSWAALHVRHHMPAKWVGHVETCWNNGTSFGPSYYRPVPPGLDFLGVDAYVHGPITRDEFNRQVRPILSHMNTLDKDVLVVVQAFEDQERAMPTAAQLQWWVEAAPTRTVGLAWFILEHPGQWEPATHGFGRGLVDYPHQLAAVQWYAGVCGLVPASIQPPAWT